MGMQKNIEAKVIESLKEQRLTCGDCVGFECEIVRDKKLCCERGIMETQKPCRQFVPDTNSLSSLVEDEETFIALSRIVNAVDDAQLRKLGALLMREKQTRAEGFNMGQKVYVRYRGQARADYLSNFMTAYIMYADKDVIRICSRDGKLTMTFSGRAQEAIYDDEAFEPIRLKMLKKKRYADPNVQKHVAKHLRTLEEYELGLSEKIDIGEIPTIDKVFKTNGVKKSKSNDLVSIVNAIESGYSVKPERPKKGKSTTKKQVKGEKKGGIKHFDVS